MDQRRFDRVARSFAGGAGSSRRGFLLRLAAALTGAASAAAGSTGAAAKCDKACPPDQVLGPGCVCRCRATGRPAKPDQPCPCPSGTSRCGANCLPPCRPLDRCHVAGVCDPATGSCTNPAAPDGRPCETGDLCTAGSCQAGLCVQGSVTVVCPDCQSCDPASGACRPDDALTCDDGDACTNSVCLGGSCSSTAVTCDPCLICRDGSCVEDTAQEGALCGGDACRPQRCRTGTCAEEPVVCDTDGSLCGGSCDETTGGCVYPDDQTACADATCRGATAVSARFCDGQGACAPGTETDCSPFACQDGACASGLCDGPTDCAAGVCNADGSCCPAADACPIDDLGFCCDPDRGATETCCPAERRCCECFAARDARPFCCDPEQVCRSADQSDPTYDPGQDLCCYFDELCLDGACKNRIYLLLGSDGAYTICDNPICGRTNINDLSQGACCSGPQECLAGGCIATQRPCTQASQCLEGEICTDPSGGVCCLTSKVIQRAVNDQGQPIYECCGPNARPSSQGGTLACCAYPDVCSTFRVNQPRL